MAYLEVFGSVLLASFGAFTLLSGAFTAYFGAGRSRKIGLGLMIFGLLSVLVFTSFTFGFTPVAAYAWDRAPILDGLVGVLGATVGAFLAIGLFVFAIMRA